MPDPANTMLPPQPTPPPEEGWRVLLVEDDPDARRQVAEYFATRPIAGRPLQFQEVGDWQDAFRAVKERKADLVILDVYRGEAEPGGERVGERVLERLKESGFVPVILYTNIPEGLDDLTSQFVRLVPKTDGLAKLHDQIKEVFATNIPQIHRAISDHLDRALRDYMWGFVVNNWSSLSAIASKPEFLRVLLQRLALSFVREGVELTASALFPAVNGQGISTASELAHPAEFYVKPPLGCDPVLGDIRARMSGNQKDYLVVLWPTCDMVSTGGRKPKTEIVLCSRGTLLQNTPEGEAFQKDQSKTARARGKLEDLMRNQRQSRYGNPDRVHFLPGVLDLPDLLIDFQALEVLRLDEVKEMECLGSLTSPHAELMGSRFDRYRGRIGTPDLDCQLVAERFVASLKDSGPAAQKKE
jgi:CheY-like chemotaxis protein